MLLTCKRLWRRRIFLSFLVSIVEFEAVTGPDSKESPFAHPSDSLHVSTHTICANVVDLSKYPHLVSIDVSGGEDIDDNEYYPVRGSLVGSIISSYYVLSVIPYPCNLKMCKYTVRVAPETLGKGGIEHQAQLLAHPNFTIDTWKYFGALNDVGLYKLDIPITFGNRAQPVQIFEGPEVEELDELCVSLVGWHTGTEDFVMKKGMLRRVNLTLSPRRVCSRGLKLGRKDSYRENRRYDLQAYTNVLPKGFLCATDRVQSLRPSAICHGIRGSPLLVDGKLAGLRSALLLGYRHRLPDYSNALVYVDVTHHRDWIRAFADP